MKSLIKKIEKRIEGVSITLGEKADGASHLCFMHEIEMPVLLKEEMKKEGKNVKSVSC